MSVDIFGRKLTRANDENSNRGPLSYGFKVTADGQYDMENKRLICNVGNPNDVNDAVPFGSMMTIINHELQQIQKTISSIRHDIDLQKKNILTMRNNFIAQKKNISSIQHNIEKRLS